MQRTRLSLRANGLGGWGWWLAHRLSGRRRRAADAGVRPVEAEAEIVAGKSWPGRCGFRAQAATRKSKGAKKPAASRMGRWAG